MLAKDLGAMSQLGIFDVPDRMVGDFMWRHEPAGERASRVLEAAGAGIEHDPHWDGVR